MRVVNGGSGPNPVSMVLAVSVSKLADCGLSPKYSAKGLPPPLIVFAAGSPTYATSESDSENLGPNEHIYRCIYDVDGNA